jgi:hypothetical protein
MALLETIGIRPGTPIDIADTSQEPLPRALEESVDEAIDRALAQRPDLIARLASVRAKEAEVRRARADYWPRLAARAALGANIGELKVETVPTRALTRCSTTPASGSSGRCSRGSSAGTRCASPSRCSGKPKTS